MKRAALLALGAAVLAGPMIGEAVAQAPRQREGAHTQTYRVAQGDSAFTIAWRLAMPWIDIARANRLDPAAPVRPGQILAIPRPPSARGAARPAPAIRFAWPLNGELERGFRAGSPGGHDGLDIAAPAGTPVRAAAGGQVIFAGEEPRQFGQLVVVDHGQGWHSAYGFLSRIGVREGDRVRAGARLGWVGNTGLAQGDELHFELRHDNRPVDPLPLLAPGR